MVLQLDDVLEKYILKSTVTEDRKYLLSLWGGVRRCDDG